MKTIINCQNISKSYQKKEVFKNFSYNFKECGLYVLFGESGSGKTTFLNTITGAIKFDEGKVRIYEKTYDKEVKYDEIKDYIAYITQNNYFVYYLKVWDNLLLTLNNKKDINKIKEYLKEFKLEDKKNNYLSDLSGGEKQRLAIIMALLQKKKIIVLDEPTSSLDIDNRDLILDILNKLKNNNLIIIATHDSKLLEIADKKIDFNNLTSEENDKQMLDSPLIIKNKFRILPFMLKQLWDKKRNKKASLFLIIVFTLVTLGLSACSNFQEKLMTSLINIYHINFVNYDCNLDNNADFCDGIVHEYGGYNTFLYSGNISYNIEGLFITSDYNLMLKTLPFDEEKVAEIRDLIVYGGYFETEDDIIINERTALKISEDISSLIGKNYEVKLPNETKKFRIVGILKNTPDDIYLTTLLSGNQLGELEFVSDKFVNRYRNNNLFRNYGNFVKMRAYFNKTEDLINFYSTYEKENNRIRVEKFASSFIRDDYKIQRLNYFLLPSLIIAFVIVLLFYYQMENIQNKYRKHILAIYNYYGYNWSNIIVSNIFTSIVAVTIKFMIGVGFGILIGYILNPILLKKNITNFVLFIPDYYKLLLLLGLLSGLALIFSLINSLLLKKKGWLKTLREDGDLL